MQKKVLVIQHVPNEGLGIIGPELKRKGIKAHYIRIYRGEKVPREAKGFGAVIALGGPMGVYEEEDYPFIKNELGLIRWCLREEKPLLGVCLGSQMLAAAAGAPVYKGKKKEIGFYKISLTDEGVRDSLLMGLPRELTVFQWHGDTFDIPPLAKNLASSELIPNQLLKVGKHAYGFQFHFEVTEEMIREFIEAGSDELKAVKYIDPKKIIAEAPDYLPDLLGHGSVIVRRFLRLACF